MNTTSSPEAIHEPHLRKRGTRTKTAVTVSAIPSSNAAARLKLSGTLACASRTAMPTGSVIFQRPDTMKMIDVRIAEIQLRLVFHPGSSSGAIASPRCAILSFMLYILALFVVGALAQTADLAITGARIYPVDPAHPIASAIAVKGGKILALDDIARFIGPSTRQIDARGGTIIPGFIDSHGHMEALGDSLETLDLRGTRSVEEIAAIVRKAVQEHKPGEWIRGHSWDQNNWTGKQFPTAELISAAAPQNPVYLTRVDGHAGWANRKALKIAGVTATTLDPRGGKVLRDATGAPTGVLIDRAEELVAGKIPPPGEQQVRERLRRAALACARLGITTVHDAGVSREALDAYRALIRDRQLPIRIYAMIGGESDLWREFLKRGPELGDRLTIRSIKLMADGALGSRGAALK